MKGYSRSFALMLIIFALASVGLAQTPTDDKREYMLLATNRTSTMEKELNETASKGYRFDGIMGGKTAFGGQETVVIMSRSADDNKNAKLEYKLLATNKTSTMQKEMSQAAEMGYEYKGQTVFETTFGGREVVIILERDRSAATNNYEYKLLATNKTSTMQKELTGAAKDGFIYVGVTVGETAFGGSEVVVITRRPKK